MKANAVNVIIVTFVSVLFILTSIQGYENHIDFSRKWEMVDKLLSDPHARPDAWSKSDDDSRTIQLCVAMVAGSKSPARLIDNLPNICKKALKNGSN